MEIRSFGLQVRTAPDLYSMVQALEDEDNKISGVVLHTAIDDPSAMEVIEFFAKEEEMRTIILPQPGRTLPERARNLEHLPHVTIPSCWTRDALKRAVSS